MGAQGAVACRVVAHGMVTRGMVAHRVVARRMVAHQAAAAPCPAGGLGQGHFGAASGCLALPLAMTPEIAPKPWH